MRLYKSSIQGSYQLSLFKLSINKKNVLNEQRQIKDEYGNIFFHEYIHFLQDVLTSFGLHSICDIARKLSSINQEIINSDSPTFPLPFHSSDPNQLLAKLNELLVNGSDLLDGDRDFEVINIQQDPYTYDASMAGRNFVEVNILYRDNSEPDSFYLGAGHFLESMAHILERNFSFDDDAPPFPYKVVEKVIKALFPIGERTDHNLITIIEMSLESHDPASYFYEYYLFCEKHHLTFNATSISYFDQTNVLKWNGRNYRFRDFYYPNATKTRDAFKAMFNHDKLKPMLDWALHILGNGIKIRRSGFSFTQLLASSSSHEKVRDKMAWLIKKLGTPVMTDSAYGMFMLSPDKKISEEEMVYLLGLDAIIDVLNGQTICTVLPYCANGQGGADITDASCYGKPWERTKVEPLCLFAQYWIMWGFVKKEVQL